MNLKKIILTAGKFFFNNELIINKKLLMKGHISYVGFLITQKIIKTMHMKFLHQRPLSSFASTNKSKKYSTFIYSSKINQNINFLKFTHRIF